MMGIPSKPRQRATGRLASSLPPGVSVSLPAPEEETAFAYLYQGTAAFGVAGEPASAIAPNLVVFRNDGDSIQATATGDGEARFIFAPGCFGVASRAGRGDRVRLSVSGDSSLRCRRGTGFRNRS